MHTIDLPNGHLKIDPDGEKKKKKKKKNLRRRLCVCFWNAFGLESRVRTVGRSMAFFFSLSLSHAYIRNLSLSLSLSLDRSVAFGNVQPAAARV